MIAQHTPNSAWLHFIPFQRAHPRIAAGRGEEPRAQAPGAQVHWLAALPCPAPRFAPPDGWGGPGEGGADLASGPGGGGEGNLERGRGLGARPREVTESRFPRAATPERRLPRAGNWPPQRCVRRRLLESGAWRPRGHDAGESRGWGAQVGSRVLPRASSVARASSGRLPALPLGLVDGSSLVAPGLAGPSLLSDACYPEAWGRFGAPRQPRYPRPGGQGLALWEHGGLQVRWVHRSARWDPRAGRRGDPSHGGAGRASCSPPWARACDRRTQVGSGLWVKRKANAFPLPEESDENRLADGFYLWSFWNFLKRRRGGKHHFVLVFAKHEFIYPARFLDLVCMYLLQFLFPSSSFTMVFFKSRKYCAWIMGMSHTGGRVGIGKIDAKPKTLIPLECLKYSM